MKIIEVSKMDDVTGRSNVRIALHSIYENETEYNKNGISWKEEFVESNRESATGMPIIASFLTSDQTIPSGHGDYEILEDGTVSFGDTSVVVGVIEKTSIETIELNGEQKRVLIGEGYLFNQRFSGFVDWLKETAIDEQIKTSIEIGAKSPNTTIIYKDGYKEKGRVPSIYQYTGTAILYLVEPSDDTAVLLEVNQVVEENKTVVEEISIDVPIEHNNEIKVEVKPLAKKTKIVKKLELNELSIDDIRSIIRDEFNEVMTPTDWSGDYDYSEYWVDTMYATRAILQSWDDCNVYYSIPYSIDGNGAVVLGEATRVEPAWNPIVSDPNDDENEAPIKVDMSALKAAVENKMPNKTMQKGGKMMEANEQLIQELNSKVEELTAKMTELNTAIVEANKAIESKEVETTQITEELNSLKAFKEAKDIEAQEAEAQAKIAEINTYFDVEIKKNGFSEVELNSLKEEYVEKNDFEGLKAKEAELCVKRVKELNSVQKTVEINATDNTDLFMAIHNTEKSEEDMSDLF